MGDNSVMSSKESSLYALENESKMIVNNQKFSDVIFEVGQEKVTVYGHSLLLSLASSVFERMFHGDMKESNLKLNQDKPIQVLDITATGFLNMLKYIYSYKIDEFLDLSEICETYIAGHKYDVKGLEEQISKYIKLKLNEDNCCLIYDQLIQIQSQGIEIQDIQPIKDIQKMIQSNSQKCFNNEYFVKICKFTLMELLQIDLFIVEIDVLKSCVKWIDEEISRLNLEPTQANKQKIFEPFKGLIKFESLSLEDFNEFSEIQNLLNFEEIGRLTVFLADKSKGFVIKCETQRKKFEVYQIVTPFSYLTFHTGHPFHGHHTTFFEFRTSLSVNKLCFVKKIHSTLNQSINNVRFTISNVEKTDQYIKLIDGYWCVEFKNTIKLIADINYNLIFSFNHANFNSSTSNRYNNNSYLHMEIGKETINFLLNGSMNCISKIDFFILS